MAAFLLPIIYCISFIKGMSLMLANIITVLEFLAIYFGWLSFIIIGLCLCFIKKRFYIKSHIVIILLSMIFIWSHYIERYIIVVQEQTISKLGFKADVILVADVHLGYYKDQYFLQRIVDKINEIPADYVVVAGDYLYKVDNNFEKLFAPFSQLNKPVYTIRGNHDYNYPRDHVTKDLFTVLDNYGVKLVEQKIVDMGDHQLAGLGDRLEGNDSANFLLKAKSEKPLLVLAHNPDSVDRLLEYNTAILMAGHTHCGQVRVPWLDSFIIRTEYGITCGLENFKGIPVFITPGLGETNLPLRLFNPPTINVLHLRP